jgi:hypothetical protein
MLVNYLLTFLFLKFIFRGFVVKIEKIIRSEMEKLIHQWGLSGAQSKKDRGKIRNKYRVSKFLFPWRKSP